jgi:hypothetical protein
MLSCYPARMGGVALLAFGGDSDEAAESSAVLCRSFEGDGF